MTSSADATGKVLEQLLQSVNGHELDKLVSCFADDYVNETPAHPHRGFRGREQVRRNWTDIFARVPDVHAEVRRSALQDDALWTEWEMSGTRIDGAAFLMRGVVIFAVTGGSISSARFYLEPVEEISGDVNAAVSRVVGNAAESR
ncbi:nuclear transport factor 2 family protein [Arthrobacter sp. RT-1]|jgi:ketosteroid isomerase-like protein|uniref:nuclear transport factor 2 family protein n=1 Tax=Arthrobacter sp. RT-1 TaxID=2292263 RepID=UPI000E1FB07A|nr:nuclear transport factor 2 family protein [Arthrobacter sp. RT-1]RDV08567.1 nuclear transport factor 2 family protein [Arthrobacter sp. RT-1]